MPLMYHIKKGIDLPIAGQPEQGGIGEFLTSEKIALLGTDYVGMRPALSVKVGDTVRRGQTLFRCKKTEGVNYTAPVAGKVVAINRGERRAFQSLVLARTGAESQVEFDRKDIRTLLVESGLWTALRTRPWSKIPAPSAPLPRSLFVNTMESHPLAPNPAPIIEESAEDFKNGLRALGKLMQERPIYLCHHKDHTPPVPEGENIQLRAFYGKHPAGLSGTHIHFVDPVGPGRTVWYIAYQDVIAIGKLVQRGELSYQRVAAIGGPRARRPRLVRLCPGSCLSEILQHECHDGPTRVISGSLFNGTTAEGVLDYLGRYHTQVTLLPEEAPRVFLGWQRPGWDKFSIKRVFASTLALGRRFSLNTDTNGSHRAMVPVGSFERVMPLDILPTQLLRALMVNDIEQATALGCLELDEEDLALCTFVSPGKEDFGPLLRNMLNEIEREG